MREIRYLLDPKVSIDLSRNRIQKFRSSEVQEFRSSGVQKFRSSGVQKFRSSEVQKFRSSGVQKFRSSGVRKILKIAEQLIPFIKNSEILKFRQRAGGRSYELHRF